MGLHLESLAHEQPYLERYEKSIVGKLQEKLFQVFFWILSPISLVWFKFSAMLANILSLVVLIGTFGKIAELILNNISHYFVLYYIV